MKRLIARRPTPAMAVACTALFVSLGGVSYGVATGSIDSREIKNNSLRTQDIATGGVRTQDIATGGVHSADLRNDSIRTEDLRNNEIRGLDIRNSTIRGIEVALNSLTGSDIAENTLGTVPSATAADRANTAGNTDTLDGLDSTAFARSEDLGRFSLKLTAGQTVTVASHGQVSVMAECIDGAQDEVRLYATTTGPALLNGDDNFLNETTPLIPGTSSVASELVGEERSGSSAAEVEEIGGPDNGGGYVIGLSDGKGLHLQGGSTILGYNLAGGKCLIAGELSKTG